jgi:hypothetical protein
MKLRMTIFAAALAFVPASTSVADTATDTAKTIQSSVSPNVLSNRRMPKPRTRPMSCFRRAYISCVKRQSIPSPRARQICRLRARHACGGFSGGR